MPELRIANNNVRINCKESWWFEKVKKQIFWCLIPLFEMQNKWRNNSLKELIKRKNGEYCTLSVYCLEIKNKFFQ